MTATSDPPAVVGLDLSLTGNGIASTRGWCERIGRDGVTRLPLDQRLVVLDQLTNELIGLVRHPDLVVIEQPPPSVASGGALERHALWWMVVRRLRAADIPLAEVTSGGRCKYATGVGNAKKTAVVDAVARRWPRYETGGDDNLCDAVVLAAMGADHLGHPLATMPATHRGALKAVAWPDVPGWS